MFKITTLFFFLFISSQVLKAQLVAELSIENQSVVGTDFFFDIFLTRDVSSSGDIYLDNSDFIITFNSSNFTNPVLTKESEPSPPFGIQNGYCDFSPTNFPDPNSFGAILNCSFTYFGNTSTSISGDELIINLNGVIVSNQTEFNEKVAKIDNTTSIHRLGRFRLSGITNPNGTAGLNWKVTGSGLITNVTAYTQTTTPWPTSTISVVISNHSDTPLPVDLSYFYVKSNKKIIELNWKVIQEFNTKGYEIQRTLDLTNFRNITSLPAQGGTSPHTYSYLDADVRPNTTYYYRLKMLDNDGQFEYSPVRSAKIEDESLMRVFPNPVDRELGIDMFAIEEGSAMLKIWNNAGIEMYIQSLELLEGNNVFTIETANWAEGVYFIQIKTAEGTRTEKFLKTQ